MGDPPLPLVFFWLGSGFWGCLEGSFVVWGCFWVLFGLGLLLNSPWVATEWLLPFVGVEYGVEGSFFSGFGCFLGVAEGDEGCYVGGFGDVEGSA